MTDDDKEEAFGRVPLETTIKAAAWDEIRHLLPTLIAEVSGLREDFRRVEAERRRSNALPMILAASVGVLFFVVLLFVAYYLTFTKPLSDKIDRLDPSTTSTTISTTHPDASTTTTVRPSPGASTTTDTTGKSNPPASSGGAPSPTTGTTPGTTPSSGGSGGQMTTTSVAPRPGPTTTCVTTPIGASVCR